MRSYSRPGESLVFFALKDSAPPASVPDAFYQVRKKVGDIRNTLPSGILGPFFNDEFGDTYTNIYAITGDGFGYRDLKRFGDRIRAELLRVHGVAKVDFIGEQDEKIFVELSNTKLATLGIDPAQIFADAGGAERDGGRRRVRHRDRSHLPAADRRASTRSTPSATSRSAPTTACSGSATSPQSSAATSTRRSRRCATRDARRSASASRWSPAATSSSSAATSTPRWRASAAQLPVGVEIAAVASMPRAVQRSINQFVRSLAEAVIIVLAVSLLSLGLRTGLVVALSIPLVLAITFLFMWLIDIGLHKISLGALILSLGLLVDDAIIAVEMMAIKLEQGFDRFRAASFAYTSTAFPMLTGTLITVAGFLPIATAKSGTGEYTRSIFQVSAIALIASWVVAVVVIPYLGYRMLPDFTGRVRLRSPRGCGRGCAGGRRRPPVPPAHADPDHVYRTPFYRSFRAQVDWCVGHRKLVLFATLGLFAAAIAAFRFVPQQFFPSSSRPELLIDLRLHEGSSFAATLAEAKRMEAILDRETGIESFTAYVGSGSPRFYLPLDQQLQQSNFAQFVVVAASNEERERLRSRAAGPVRDRVPGAARPRVAAGERPAGRLSGAVPRQRRGRGDGAPDRPRGRRRDARRSGDARRPVRLGRADQGDPARHRPEQGAGAGVHLAGHRGVPAELGVGLHRHPVPRRRQADRRRAARRRRGAGADVVAARPRAADARGQGDPDHADRRHPLRARGRHRLAPRPAADDHGPQRPEGRRPGPGRRQPHQPAARRRSARELPLGYRVEMGGAVEDSARGQRSIAAGVPLMLIVVLTLLMLQLQSFSRMAMVVLTAPLGLIGVVAALLAFGKPFGFVAMLGTIALSGIIMRNSVILVDQIDTDIAAGVPAWDAIVGATVRRFRPIVLTAAAAVLALIPLARSDFFGPMAVAMMGGIVVATGLTLAFLPALYAAWFRVRRAVPSDLAASA